MPRILQKIRCLVSDHEYVYSNGGKLRGAGLPTFSADQCSALITLNLQVHCKHCGSRNRFYRKQLDHALESLSIAEVEAVFEAYRKPKSVIDCSNDALATPPKSTPRFIFQVFSFRRVVVILPFMTIGVWLIVFASKEVTIAAERWFGDYGVVAGLVFGVAVSHILAAHIFDRKNRVFDKAMQLSKQIAQKLKSRKKR